MKNAAVQTTQSLESPEQLAKFSSFSSFNKRTRSYIKYSKLDTSDGTRFSDDDESTQCKLLIMINRQSLKGSLNFSWRFM